MKLDENAKKLIMLLQNNGHRAYAVGGCVRDALMGIKAKDTDITTSATPEQTEKILYDNGIKFVETGIKHGTVTAVVNHIPYEITTFRVEGEYNDLRHPENVCFVSDINVDLSRRDFTMNAIAYNDTDGYIDIFGGINDINSRVIKCVGNPDKRFNEDALRILRAIRFASVLGFDIDENTKQAVFNNKELLLKISAERIFTELKKLLLGDNAEKILLEYRDVIAVIIPQIKDSFDFPQNSKWHIYDVYTHIVKSVAVAPKKDYIRLALLLHDIGKPFVKTTDENGQDHFKGHPSVSVELSKAALKQFKVSNDIFYKVIKLVKIHDKHITLKPSNIKRWLRELGEDLTLDFIDVKIADMKTHNLDLAGAELEYLEQVKELTRKIIASGEPYRISDLKINGNDLLAIGYKGKQISDELDSLINIVSSNPEFNTREKLLNQAKHDLKGI
ncbi:MAG: CCA tRNA nucleotidyltransferase [Eubacterium sp.]